jgi:molecular chaperone DnaK
MHAVEQDLKEYGDKLTAEQKDEIQAVITAVEIACQGEDVAKIKEELEKVYPAMKVLLDIKTAEEQAKAQAEAAPTATNDDVVDATFTEKKD